MTSELTQDMIHLMARGLLKFLDETPATEGNLGLLQQCKKTVEWLQSQAQNVDADMEVMESLLVADAVVSQKIDQANAHAQRAIAMRSPKPGEVRPFDVAKLMAAWDREYPGGSAAVLELFREIGSRVRERMRDQEAGSDK